MQSLKLPSALFGKEFLLHKNPKVFSGPARIYNLFTSVLSTALRPVVLKLVGGTEPSKFHAGTHRTLS